MIIETMPLKTITPKYNPVNFDGHVYTNIGESYNEDTYVRPVSVLPSVNTYVYPNKVSLEYLTVSCNEGAPQIVKYSDASINMEPLLDYSYVTAIPFDLTIIQKNISSTRAQYSNEFLAAVESC